MEEWETKVEKSDKITAWLIGDSWESEIILENRQIGGKSFSLFNSTRENIKWINCIAEN